MLLTNDFLNFNRFMPAIKYTWIVFLLALFSCASSHIDPKPTTSAKVEVPDWALPGSATHKQVPPPSDFHRPTTTENKRIGIFDGQSEVRICPCTWFF